MYSCIVLVRQTLGSYCADYSDKCIKSSLYIIWQINNDCISLLNAHTEIRKTLPFFTSQWGHTLTTPPLLSHQLKQQSASTAYREKKLINMGYWFISHLRGKTRPPISTLTHCLKYQSHLPVQDKETRGVQNTLTEGLWQEKNRLIFFSFLVPRQCLEVYWIHRVETQTRPVLCEQKEPRYTVISVRVRSAAPHPPATYRSAIESDRKAQK